MTLNADQIGTTQQSLKLAHEIATLLHERGQQGHAGVTVLALALGIYIESQPNTHRGMQCMTDLVCAVAVEVFDKLRAARSLTPGRG